METGFLEKGDLFNSPTLLFILTCGFYLFNFYCDIFDNYEFYI